MRTLLNANVFTNLVTVLTETNVAGSVRVHGASRHARISASGAPGRLPYLRHKQRAQRPAGRRDIGRLEPMCSSLIGSRLGWRLEHSAIAS